MKDTPEDQSPAPVDGSPRRAGEVRARCWWAEPRVWTDRMLEALDKGVHGGRWPNARFHDALGLFSLERAWRRHLRPQ